MVSELLRCYARGAREMTRVVTQYKRPRNCEKSRTIEESFVVSCCTNPGC